MCNTAYQPVVIKLKLLICNAKRCSRKIQNVAAVLAPLLLSMLSRADARPSSFAWHRLIAVAGSALERSPSNYNSKQPHLWVCSLERGQCYIAARCDDGHRVLFQDVDIIRCSSSDHMDSLTGREHCLHRWARTQFPNMTCSGPLSTLPASHAIKGR